MSQPTTDSAPDSATPFKLTQADLSLIHEAPVDPPQKPLTIKKLGRYSLKYVIKETSEAVVYAARDPLLSRSVAVKLYKFEFVGSQGEELKKQFLTQAANAAGLSHPNIVNIFDIDSYQNQVYLVMELLKGKSLSQMLEEGWRPNHSQAALIVRRIADALDYAHSKKVIHGNIKLGNIILLSSTQPRVLDFGLTCLPLLGVGEDNQPLNFDVDILQFRAPEQIQKLKPDPRIDVFALGVLLYKLLTQQNPFQGTTFEELTQAILQTPAIAPHALNRNISQDLSAVAQRAIHKDLAHRYKSARAFSRDLYFWLAQKNKTSNDVGIFAIVSKRKKPEWFLSIMGLMCITAASVGWYYWHPQVLNLWYSYTGSNIKSSPDQNNTRIVELVKKEDPSNSKPSEQSTASGGNIDPENNSANNQSSFSFNKQAQGVTKNAGSALGSKQDKAIILKQSDKETLPINSPIAASNTQKLEQQNLNPNSGVASSTSLITKNKAAPGISNQASSKAEKDIKEQELRPSKPKTNSQKNKASAIAAKNIETQEEPALGTLRIAVVPWGEVEINGAAVGITPPLNQLTLPKGQHQITIRNGDYPPYTTTITLDPGQLAIIKHRFGS